MIMKCHNSDKLIDFALKNDLIPDCHREGENFKPIIFFEDEPYLFLYSTENVRWKCGRQNEIPCLEGVPICYNISQICKFVLNIHKRVEPCRNGAHIQNCSQFECNAMFKCSSSYCIPWSYVCDGKRDCLYGNDESYKPICFNSPKCETMYKCRGHEHTCLHLGNVCDESVDCPQGEDEVFCELTKCPPGCRCLLYATHCYRWKTHQLHKLSYSNHLSLSLDQPQISNLTLLIQHFSNLICFKITCGKAMAICEKLLSSKIVHMEVVFTPIHTLKKKCFQSQGIVKIILLQNNNISMVESKSFLNMSNLRFLSLANNPITSFPENLVLDSPHLKLLNVSNLSLVDISTRAFAQMHISTVQTTDFHLCCIAESHMNCTAQKPWYISCEDLLPDDQMRTVYVVVSVFVFVCNGMSAICFLLSRKSNVAFSTSVVSININNTLCGTYLSIISISDLSLSGEFMVKEEAWRKGSTCFSAFGIVVWFTILTEMLLVFLSISRLMIVIHPVDTNFKQPEFVLQCVACLYISSFVMGIAIVMIMIVLEGVLPMNLCLPFIDPNSDSLIIKILTWFVASSQFLTSVAILMLHILLLYNLSESQKKHNQIKERWCF